MSAIELVHPREDIKEALRDIIRQNGVIVETNLKAIDMNMMERQAIVSQNDRIVGMNEIMVNVLACPVAVIHAKDILEGCDPSLSFPGKVLVIQ